jgi:hypothetical protein
MNGAAGAGFDVARKPDLAGIQAGIAEKIVEAE